MYNTWMRYLLCRVGLCLPLFGDCQLRLKMFIVLTQNAMSETIVGVLLIRHPQASNIVAFRPIYRLR